MAEKISCSLIQLTRKATLKKAHMIEFRCFPKKGTFIGTSNNALQICGKFVNWKAQTSTFFKLQWVENQIANLVEMVKISILSVSRK